MSAQTTCRIPRPRCTKCTKTSLKFLAMRLSPQEPKRRYDLQGTSIPSLGTTKPKDGKGHMIHLPLIHSPKQRWESGMWNQKGNKHQTSQRLNPHLTRSTRIENKRGRRKNGTRTPSTNSSWNGRKEARSMIQTNS
jgi:hypothetical protein